MTQSPYGNIDQLFTEEERLILLSASVDDILAPPDTLGARIPASLRAKFMAVVVRSMEAKPLPDESNLTTDPKEP